MSDCKQAKGGCSALARPRSRVNDRRKGMMCMTGEDDGPNQNTPIKQARLMLLN